VIINSACIIIKVSDLIDIYLQIVLTNYIKLSNNISLLKFFTNLYREIPKILVQNTLEPWSDGSELINFA